jgi:Putative auto-transporter adhesin, head GIN domain
MLKNLSLAALFAAVLSGSAIAGSDHDNERIIREVKLNTGFTKIIVDGDAELVLIEGEPVTATIEDEAVDVNSTRITTKNGVLTVQVRRNRDKRPVIKIPVHRLEMLEVNGDGEVRTVSSLKSKKLAVLINGTCKISLCVAGSISVNVADGFEYEYLNKERIRIMREVE